MIRRRLYYCLKPYIPWSLRVGVRGWFARRQRNGFKHVWPIDESAGRLPEGWPGWPAGKKFAFVITHDVEGPEGVKKCRQLAALELKKGFRSSFNFIPEGSYTVPDDLRKWLADNGFEVGVHDLNHDGKLFDSRDGFVRKAQRINRYLREWGAVGFRAGFMLRNLDWYHDLEIEYDLSTFDTDPFEPMPDGAGTIFPFWVPAPTGQKSQVPSPKSQATGDRSDSARPADVGHATMDPRLSMPASREGYVELPYTLAQDSTLFLVLRETNPEIWLGKLDWVAGRGGMALVNVHPDYLAFPGDVPRHSTFPAAYYETLLSQVRDRHANEYWAALARDVAKVVRRNFTPASPTACTPSSF